MALLSDRVLAVKEKGSTRNSAPLLKSEWCCVDTYKMWKHAFTFVAFVLFFSVPTLCQLTCTCDLFLSFFFLIKISLCIYLFFFFSFCSYNYPSSWCGNGGWDTTNVYCNRQCWRSRCFLVVLSKCVNRNLIMLCVRLLLVGYGLTYYLNSKCLHC